MALEKGIQVPAATGKLGVLLPGMGAVATTFIAGCLAVRRGLGEPIGSLAEMGTIRLGKRPDGNVPMLKDYVPLSKLDDLVFGGWDIFPENCFDAAKRAGVLAESHLAAVEEELSAISPMPAVFDRNWVKRLDGPNVKTGRSKMDLARQLMDDMCRFKEDNDCERLSVVWCGSTEVYTMPSEVHMSLDKFEEGLERSDQNISPSQVYAYAALKLGVPFANGAPNLTVDVRALQQLAKETSAPICGKDFKTGQTLMKTILAPGFKARLLGLEGWYSTNILGNRDGEVLDDPDSFKAKEVSKLGVLEHILQPDRYPQLYGDFAHVVRINYYPPRGDCKEGWDNIDIKGWLGYPMQLKLNFLCRDSILAAPLVLDLALFQDFAKRAGMSGIQEWLSLFFKSPMTPEGLYPEHDLFIQLMKFKNTLRYTNGDDVITHLGAEYYD